MVESLLFCLHNAELIQTLLFPSFIVHAYCVSGEHEIQLWNVRLFSLQSR
jgi:hypothetical protein